MIPHLLYYTIVVFASSAHLLSTKELTLLEKCIFQERLDGTEIMDENAYMYILPGILSTLPGIIDIV